MRELLEKGQRVVMVPHDFKNANKGVITDVAPDGFTLQLDYDPIGILRSNYCEFYTQTPHGMLFFTSYMKEMNDKTLKISSPAKHKFLQRRQYTRIKFVEDTEISADFISHKIKTLDISAGGMKFITAENLDIEKTYYITLQLSKQQSIECMYSTIRVEKNDDKTYTHSGRFEFKSNIDKMILIQYCTKRAIEIRNK